jgi:hypothetical protein
MENTILIYMDNFPLNIWDLGRPVLHHRGHLPLTTLQLLPRAQIDPG